MPLPFAIVLQCHAGKIRKLDVAIVRQKLTEMELNGVQYPQCGAADGERSEFFGGVPRAVFRMRMKGSHKMYRTIWLRVDLCQSPLLLPDGGGCGVISHVPNRG